MRTFISILFIYITFSTNGTVPHKWESITPIPLNSESAAGKYIYLFRASKPLSPDSIIKQAQSGGFILQKNSTVNLLNTSDSNPIWLYFKSPNFNTSDQAFLIIENYLFNKIKLYKYINDSLCFVGMKGKDVPYNTSDNISSNQILFRMDPNAIYFIESYSEYSTVFPIFIRNNYSNSRSTIIHNMFNAFYWGVLTVMACTALLFFVRSKEYLFLFYALFLMGLILLNLSLDGYLFAYVWPNHPEFNNYKYGLFSLSTVFTPIFVYLFLDIPNYIPQLKWLYIFISIGFLFNALIGIVGNYNFSIIMIQVLGLIQTLLFIISGLVVYRRGYDQALYFIIAWGFYLSSVTYTILTAAGFIESTPYTNNYIQIGSLIEVIVFSLAIAGRYQQYKIKDQQSQLTLIEVLKEREILLQNQNELLEEVVSKRTQELNDKNIELRNLNSNLNEIVNEKTWELQKSIEEINAFNQQLQQFNYITSHNLRGPLSSLKGLYNLYLTEQNNTDRQNYIEKSIDVLNRMDLIIIDLNTILSQRNNTEIKETIDFNSIIENNLSLLNIRSLPCNIVIDIDSSFSVTGIKSFYESIFYNIISNALKYKKTEEKLNLTFKIHKSSDQIYTIVISDNGLGMDLFKIGDKLFGFYKRFHPHIEGKGLGLFITKTQIELMGGSIRVESTAGIGSTFIIDIPLY